LEFENSGTGHRSYTIEHYLEVLSISIHFWGSSDAQRFEKSHSEKNAFKKKYMIIFGHTYGHSNAHISRNVHPMKKVSTDLKSALNFAVGESTIEILKI
tara:strand:- start:475 stop:771 length:297 start_codon:yes stop_codon:yes gene_type:complete